MSASSFPSSAVPALDYIEPGFNDVLGVLNRHLVLVLFFTLVALVISAFLTLGTARNFEAQALIMIQNNEQTFTSDGKPLPEISAPPSESIVLSEVEVLHSRDLADLLVHDLNLEQNPVFWQSYTRPEDAAMAKQRAAQIVLDHLTVKSVGRSLIIDLRYKHPNAALAATIVNRLAQIYQEEQIKEKILTSKKTAVFLQERLEILGKKLRESAKAVEAYRVQEDLIDGAKAEVTSQQISDISSQLITAQADFAAAEAKKLQVDQIIQNKKPLEDLSAVTDSSLINLLKRDETLLLSQQAELQSKYGENHPRLKAMQAEISELKQKKNGEVNRVAETVNNDAAAAKAKIDVLQKNLDEFEQKRHRENQAAIGLRELEREADANRVLYENFLNRYKESKMLGDIQQADAKIISVAHTPSQHYGPPAFLIIVLAGLSGFLLGCLLSLLIEQFENRLYTSEQLQRLLEIPTLAVIPNVKRGKVLQYLTAFPQSPLAEAIRNLRIRLLSVVPPASPQVIMLTSSLPDEGRTKIALWLAQMIAQNNIRVLLLDADLRTPELAGYFNSNPQESLTEIALGKKPLEAALFNDAALGTLSILSGLPAQPHNIEQLSLLILQDMLVTLKLKFDIIIINAPPFSEAAETQLFGRISDQCLLVVGWNDTPANLVQSVYWQLQLDRINVTGSILSHITGRG